MVKHSLIFFLLITYSTIFTQEVNLEKYKYIIVPEKFDFLKENDQYQTSSLTKFLFEKKGFTVFLGNENLPEELQNNKCNAIIAAVKEKSNMLTLKATIEVKDCFGKIIYTSKIGKTKIKEYKRGYQEAIRNAYNSMTDFEYSYKKIKQKELKNKIDKTILKKEEVKKEEVKKEEISEVLLIKKKKEEKTEKIAKRVAIPMLYAQKKDYGFQLINTIPEIIFNILNTSQKDVFIIKDKNGIIYKNGKNWIVEYYESGKYIKEQYQIKF